MWSEERLRRHLRFFNGPDVGDRVTGSAGFASAAAYAAAQLQGLQPALGSAYEVGYQAPLNTILSSSLLGTPVSDSLALEIGIDFLPDGRSDSGAANITSVTFLAHDQYSSDLQGAVVLVPQGGASSAELMELRDSGARAVLLVGKFTPRLAARPIRDLLLAQISDEAAAFLFGAAPAELAIPSTVRKLRLPVRLEIDARYTPRAAALNVLAFAAGKHPALANELVLVCADLDAIGRIAGVPTFNEAHAGIGAAALLEVARHYGIFASNGPFPGRTVLFAVFSGARQGHAGIAAYVRRPLWPLRRTRTLIYLGLDPAEEAELRSILDGADVEMRFVAAPQESDLHGHGFLERGALQARFVAEEAHAILLREATADPNRFSSDATDPLLR